MDINAINIEGIIKQVISEMNGGATDTKIKTASSTSLGNKSKVAVLTGPKKIEVKEYQIPEIGDDEMLVKVEGCGICGTDVHEYKGDPFNLIPLVLGHEGTGKIVKKGKNVVKDSSGRTVEEGDSIVTCIIPCGECDICLNHPSKTNLCANNGIYGLISDDEYHLNGWFGEYILIRKNSTFFVVNDMDLKSRILIEPSAVVVHAHERAKSTGLLKFNSKVLVQGCGPIGLLLIAVLRTSGIENIVAVDGDDKRLEMAQRLGANKTINFSHFNNFDEMLTEVKYQTCGGADFAFQCTGVPKAASNIWKFVRNGGGLCEVGFFVDNGDCTINPHLDICSKEITVVGSWVYTPQDYLITFDFIKRAIGIGLPLSDLITHEYPLDKLNEAMVTNMNLEGIKIAYINN